MQRHTKIATTTAKTSIALHGNNKWGDKGFIRWQSRTVSILPTTPSFWDKIIGIGIDGAVVGGGGEGVSLGVEEKSNDDYCYALVVLFSVRAC